MPQSLLFITVSWFFFFSNTLDCCKPLVNSEFWKVNLTIFASFLMLWRRKFSEVPYSDIFVNFQCIVVLLCILVMINGIEHLLCVYLLLVSPLVRLLLQLLPIKKSSLFVCYWVMSSLHIQTLSPHQIYTKCLAQIFLLTYHSILLTSF